jgi:hypothetical protein
MRTVVILISSARVPFSLLGMTLDDLIHNVSNNVRDLRRLFLLAEIEQVICLHRLARKPPAGGDDRGDAAAGWFHPTHPDPQQVLAAVSRFARQVRWFDRAVL